MDISDLREMMQTELEAVHTTLAGKIVSWDGSRAVVRPALPRALRDGSALPAPQIVSVPVCFPVGAGGAVACSGGFEIVGGDVVADGISLQQHTHRGDSGGTTGAAQ